MPAKPTKPAGPAYVSAHTPTRDGATVDVGVPANAAAVVLEAVHPQRGRKQVEIRKLPIPYAGRVERFKPKGLDAGTAYHFDARVGYAAGPESDRIRTKVAVRTKPAALAPIQKPDMPIGPVIIVNTRPTTPLPPGEPAVPPPTPEVPAPVPVPVTPIPTPPPPSTPDPEPPPESPSRKLLAEPITKLTRLAANTDYRLSRSQTTSATLQFPAGARLYPDAGVKVRFAQVEAYRYVRYVPPKDGTVDDIASLRLYAWIEGFWPDGATSAPIAELTGTPLGPLGVDLGSPKLVGHMRVTPKAGRAAALRAERLEWAARIEGSNSPGFEKPVVLSYLWDPPTEGENLFDAGGVPYGAPIQILGNGAGVQGGLWQYGYAQRAANVNPTYRNALGQDVDVEDAFVELAVGGHYPGEGVNLTGTNRTRVKIRCDGKMWGNGVYASNNGRPVRNLLAQGCHFAIGSINENLIRLMGVLGAIVEDCYLFAGLNKRNAIRVHGYADVIVRRCEIYYNAQSGPMGGADGGQDIGILTWYSAARRLTSMARNPAELIVDEEVTRQIRAEQLAFRLTNIQWIDNNFHNCRFSVDAGIEGVALVQGGTMTADPAESGATNVLAFPMPAGKLPNRYPKPPKVLDGDVIRGASVYTFTSVGFRGKASLATARSQIPSQCPVNSCTYQMDVATAVPLVGGTLAGW